MADPTASLPRTKPLGVWLRHVAGLALWYAGDGIDRLLSLLDAHLPGFEDSAADRWMTIVALRLFAASMSVDVCERWAAEAHPA